jgi:hypothetical protein
MNPEIEALVNEMMAKSRLYIKAIDEREEALETICKSDSKQTETAWLAAVNVAKDAHEKLDAAIAHLHAALQKR